MELFAPSSRHRDKSLSCATIAKITFNAPRETEEKKPTLPVSVRLFMAFEIV